MKKRILGLILVFCMLFGLASCADLNSIENPQEQAHAYFAVFEYLYENDPGLNSESNYLAADLTNVLLTDVTPLIELMESFCDENGYVLLLNSYDELVEKGYIKDLLFADGFLIAFDDIKLGKATLVTSAKKWRSGLGAIGAEFTVKKKNGSWEITKTQNSWIS